MEVSARGRCVNLNVPRRLRRWKVDEKKETGGECVPEVVVGDVVGVQTVVDGDGEGFGAFGAKVPNVCDSLRNTEVENAPRRGNHGFQ